MLDNGFIQLVTALFSFHVGNLYNIANYHLGKYELSETRSDQNAKHLRWSFLQKWLTISS